MTTRIACSHAKRYSSQQRELNLALNTYDTNSGHLVQQDSYRIDRTSDLFEYPGLAGSVCVSDCRE
jgi:hypothetical protein